MELATGDLKVTKGSVKVDTVNEVTPGAGVTIDSVQLKDGVVESPTGRGATFTVAASNSSLLGKAQADYKCSGIDDEVQIELALASAKDVYLLEGTFNIGTLTVDEVDRKLHGSGLGTILKLKDNEDANVINVTSTNFEICDLTIDGNRANQASGNGIYFSYDGWQWGRVHNIFIHDVKGKGIACGNGTLTACCDTDIFDVIIEDCDIGIYLSKLGGWNLTNLHIHDCDTYGIHFDQVIWAYISNSRLLGGNSGERGVLLNASNLITIANSDIDAWTMEGLKITGSCYDLIVNGNHILENSRTNPAGYSNLNIDANLYRSEIVNNNFRDTGNEKYSINVTSGAWVAGNVFSNNMISSFNIPDFNRFVSNRISTQHTDMFPSCIVATANHVVAAEALNAVSPITCALADQPDVPRNLSWTLTHANITEYTMTVIGVNTRGDTVTESKTEADGWSGQTNNAFISITSITFARDAGTGIGDTLDVGVADKLGLIDIIYSSVDVYNVKEDAANYTNYTVNTVYRTVSIDGAIGAGKDYTIWYKTNLNIIG